MPVDHEQLPAGPEVEWADGWTWFEGTGWTFETPVDRWHFPVVPVGEYEDAWTWSEETWETPVDRGAWEHGCEMPYLQPFASDHVLPSGYFNSGMPMSSFHVQVTGAS